MVQNIKYSIVIPVYNSEKSLNELFHRIYQTFAKITDQYELILVDDCSLDSSWEKLKELHKIDSRVKIIQLARNFGQTNAIICGLNHCNGEYIILMDDDLQNPPEEIPKLIKKISEGFMVVYGKYAEKKHGKVENFFSNIFQFFIHRILEIPNHIFISNFAIFKKQVIDNIISIKLSHVFLSALVIMCTPTHKIINVEVNHDKRKYGQSNYNLLKYFKFTLNLFINCSALPLIFVSFIGVFISVISIVFGLSIIIRHAVDPSYGIVGWNSLIAATTLLSGTIMISIGILGEYMRRILTQVSYTPLYIIGYKEL